MPDLFRIRAGVLQGTPGYSRVLYTTAGNHMPDLFRIRTLVCKVIGTERRPQCLNSKVYH